MDYKVINIMTTDDPSNATKVIYTVRYIKRDDIESIAPYIGNNGKSFKNLTSLETYTNKNYIVIGNCDDHVTKIKSVKRIGYNTNKEPNKV